jgi:hypothetical protein
MEVSTLVRDTIMSRNAHGWKSTMRSVKVLPSDSKDTESDRRIDSGHIVVQSTQSGTVGVAADGRVVQGRGKGGWWLSG